MTIIYGFLIVLEALVSALLIGVIFLQKTKGGMGGTAFGGGMGEAIFGSRMGNVLTKATVVLAIVFLANTILLTMLTARRGSAASVTDSIVIEQPAPAQGPVSSTPLPVPAPAETPMEMPMGDGPVEMPEAAPVVEIPVPVSEEVSTTAPVEAPPVPIEIPAEAPPATVPSE